jgi:hypothetical protein
VPFWDSITTSKWTLNNIKGVFIPFITTPVQERVPHTYKLSKEESTAVDLEIISFFKRRCNCKSSAGFGPIYF